MSSSSTVTYTSVYTDSEPGRVFWGANEELSDGGSPRVILYGYNGLPMQQVTPPYPDYMPGHEHPPSPVEVPYVPEPEYPEYLVPSNAKAPLEDQYLPTDASPTALSPGYMADSYLEEDLEEDHTDYPADEGDGDDEPSDDDDDDDDTDDEDEDPIEDEDDDEEEEHLAPVDSSAIPIVDPVPLAGDTEAFETDEAAPTHVPSPRRHTARMSVRPQTPILLSSEAKVERLLAFPIPSPSLLSPWSSPLPQIPSPPLPPPPSSLYLPPPVPTSLPLPSSPLPPLPASLSILPPVDRKEDTPEAKLPPRKRLCLTTPTSKNKVGESLTATPRPTRDPAEAVKEVASMTLEGVNARVTELAAVQEQDTQDIYAVIEDVGVSLAVHYELQAYKTRTQMQDYRISSQESLMTTMIAQVSSLQGQLSAALGQIQALQAGDQTHADDYEGAASMAVGLNNMPPRRTFAAARAAAPMTATAIEQLIEARVIRGTVHTPRECTYKDFLNCKPLTFKGTKGVVVLSQWFEKMESVFHINNCAMENQVKFATCTFFGNALTWWNSHVKAVTQDVAYAMDWKTLKKMMTSQILPKRMFHEESDEVEKYVGGLPDMIRGNVMLYQPKKMEKEIEFANDKMDQKFLTITEKQAEQKRKLEFNARNNQGHQQQNKRQNIRRAYTAGPGEKRECTGSLPLCTKCNYHHKGPCAPRCNKCKKIGHLARDCRSSGPNDYLKLKNGNHGNQRGNGNAPAKVYVVVNAGTNPDSNVVTGTFLLNDRYAFILFDTGADRSFVSTTFSSLIDITPTTLDHYYDVELADGKII
ncbi:reverse transcriptase domain-containing protein [Tanacetum coccineum]